MGLPSSRRSAATSDTSPASDLSMTTIDSFMGRIVPVPTGSSAGLNPVGGQAASVLGHSLLPGTFYPHGDPAIECIPIHVSAGGLSRTVRGHNHLLRTNTRRGEYRGNRI